MSFQFVDNNTAFSYATRKQIRSHAGKGRNAGKVLVPVSKRKELKPRVAAAASLCLIPATELEAYEPQWNEDVSVEIERPVGDGLSFPVRLAPGSTRLARKVLLFLRGPRYAPELSNALSLPSGGVSSWVRYMLLDEAFFHCAVAAAIPAITMSVTTQEKNTEAMRHMSQALRLINERLSGNDAVSNHTIAAVVAMVLYERQQGQFRRGLIHVKGLRQMTELRGGMSQLARTEPGLTPMIFRVDLECSLQLGSETLFTIEDVQRCSHALFGHDRSWSGEKIQDSLSGIGLRLFTQLSTDLWELFVDIRKLACDLNDASVGRRPRINGDDLHGFLIVLGYRLVSASSLGRLRFPSHLNAPIQFGLASFLVTFLRGLDRKTIRYPRISTLSWSAAQHNFTAQREDQEVLLWLLFVGRVSIFTQTDDSWLIPKVKTTVEALALQSWEDVRRTLAKFPWVDDLHDKAGQSLWQNSTTSTEH
ncbi:hypothetical protein EDB80DRAFT_1270 [Ilyonectria destructans]|nr:hypothetical protein EDB80DRAFT_1270 [Ilyonectria destructans]